MTAPVAFVTGAGTGIGAATCAVLADAGFAVAAVDRDTSALDGVVNSLHEKGAVALALAVDVTDAAAVADAVSRARTELGTPTAVVTAAGIMQVGPFLELTPDAWRRTLDVNLTGTFLPLQACAKAMVDDDRVGAAVAVSSVAARSPRADAADYAASKAGVISLVRSAAVALAPHGIRVNAVCPGVVDTAMTRRNADERAERLGSTAEEVLQALVAKVPLGRAASAEEIANVVRALLADGFGYVTGQAVNVCGGLEFD